MKFVYSILLAIITFAAFAYSASEVQPLATTKGGKVRGLAQEGVVSFKGIPYAAAPTGERRWRAPQPVVPWSGVLDATSYGSDCMQVPFPSDAAPLGTEPAEDCLFANVWRPEKASGKLPVLVWVYGGGFVNGGSSPDVYDGSEFARQGLVFVSFNYRIGRFGFFAHPALEASEEEPQGNFGLMDQHAALRWVQRNIEAFGGDPEAVTIMGESAGGRSVTHLMNSPQARGLFQRAIIMSGGGRSSGPLRRMREDMPGLPSAQTVGANFAKTHGITGSDSKALEALRELSAEEVAGDLNLATLFSGAREEVPTWHGPFLDGKTVVGTNEAIFAEGAHARVPVMVGATSADIGFVSASSKDELFASFGDKEALAREIFDPTGEAPLPELATAVGGAQYMIEPARYLASQVSQAGESAWHYRFSYVADSMRDEWEGAPHATEIPYAFNTVAAKYGEALTDEDRAMARAMNAYFSNFALNGDPNETGLPKWRSYEHESQSLLNFSKNQGVVVGEDPWRHRLDLVQSMIGSEPAE